MNHYGRLPSVLAWACFTVATTAAEPAPPPSPVTPPEPLRYSWRQGDTLVYAVEIEADHGDAVETQRGSVTLSVRLLQDGQATIAMPLLHLLAQRTPKPGRTPAMPGFGPPLPPIPIMGPPRLAAFSGREVTVDSRGRIVSERGEAQLPFAMGDLMELILEPLPEAAEARWERRGTPTIRTTADWPPRGPLRAALETGRHSAEEVITVEVHAVTAERVELSRAYALKTIQTVPGGAAMELTGTGTVVLDRKRGLPIDIRHRLVFCEREENREQRYPLTFTCRLLDENELRQQRERAAAAQAAAAVPPAPEEVAALLAELKSGDKTRARRAMATLRQKAPATPDDALAAALAGWLADGDGFVRQQAAEALCKWATPVATSALLKVLDGKGFDARAAAKALGNLKEKRAAPLLAAKLTDMSWRMDAATALKAIGPPAESAVAKLLRDRDWGVRLEVCRILQEAGSKDSLKTLDGLAAGDENPLVRQAAQTSADAIRAR